MNEERTLFEAGHYYEVKGPTVWSRLGVELTHSIKSDSDATMLFIDDVHPITNVSPHEIHHPVVTLDFNPDHIIYESEMFPMAQDLLLELQKLSNKKRAVKSNTTGQYFISGFPITHPDGRPLCVLLDAALSRKKYQMGFKNIVNVLPFYYGGQQQNLNKILQKIMPEDFSISTIFFDSYGKETDRITMQKRLTV